MEKQLPVGLLQVCAQGQLRLADISYMVGKGVAVSCKVTPLLLVEQKTRVT